jgi:hypothetical protein
VCASFDTEILSSYAVQVQSNSAAAIALLSLYTKGRVLLTDRQSPRWCVIKHTHALPVLCAGLLG